ARALSTLAPGNGFEHTSPARPSVLCPAVGLTGRISCRTTGTPRDAACQPASLPASPPPTIVTRQALTLSIPNGQLPTPSCHVSSPGVTRQTTWELGVGGWELKGQAGCSSSACRT